MKTLNQITEHLDNIDDSTLVSAWNEYQSNISSENQLYTFDEDFFATYFSDPMEAARATFFGGIKNWSDDYIMFNGYGNLESTSNPSEVVSISELADYINDNQHLFDYIMDEIEDEDETEE